jgi:hypothetical protein
MSTTYPSNSGDSCRPACTLHRQEFPLDLANPVKHVFLEECVLIGK